MQLILSPTLLSGPTAWPRGPLMAQAAHAATACLVTSLAHSANARAYVATPEAVAQMHKVVLKGPEKGEAGREGLRGLSERLRVGRREWEERQREGKGGGEGKEEDEEEEEFPLHYLWIEQPEDVPTCIAVAPNRKPAVSGVCRSSRGVEDETMTLTLTPPTQHTPAQALKKILNKCSLLRD